jgi:kumamolisin
MLLLRNSKPVHPTGARKLQRKPRDEEVISITVVLNPRSSTAARTRAVRQVIETPPRKRKQLSPQNWRKTHGASNAAVKRVRSFARSAGLLVLEANPDRRYVILSGTLKQFAGAFRTGFALHSHAGTIYRSHQSEIRLPAELRNTVQAVLGLENRPLMSHHAFAQATPAMEYTDPADVCTKYNFPANNGEKQRIAIVELGGGFYEEDLTAYFELQKLQKPKITSIEIGGQKNAPASPEVIKAVLDAMGMASEHQKSTISTSDLTAGLWTIEATLDVQLAGAFANGAEINVYFAPNNSQGKFLALSAAIHDPAATVLSCSWGAVEETLSPDFVQVMDDLFQDAALKGTTVCFSSGDKGRRSG